MKVTILGCGGSGGVPVVGEGGWGACDPAEPRNRRLRSSILVEQDGTRVLVDTSPDLREQLLANRIAEIEAVVWTHGHADHTHGIDDLRQVNRGRKGPLLAYADARTGKRLRRCFDYAFEPLPADKGPYRPFLDLREIDGPFEIGAMKFVPFEQDHGFGTTSLGFRIGAFGYSTDVVTMSDQGFEILAGIDTWVVDCLRPDPRWTHSWTAQTLQWIERLKPRRAILTHMGELLDYATLKSSLPAHVEPGHDGMVLEIIS